MVEGASRHPISVKCSIFRFNPCRMRSSAKWLTAESRSWGMAAFLVTTSSAGETTSSCARICRPTCRSASFVTLDQGLSFRTEVMKSFFVFRPLYLLSFWKTCEPLISANMTPSWWELEQPEEVIENIFVDTYAARQSLFVFFYFLSQAAPYTHSARHPLLMDPGPWHNCVTQNAKWK